MLCLLCLLCFLARFCGNWYAVTLQLLFLLIPLLVHASLLYRAFEDAEIGSEMIDVPACTQTRVLATTCTHHESTHTSLQRERLLAIEWSGVLNTPILRWN